MSVRQVFPAARPSRLAGPMQLHRPTSEIPELGGLGPSRLSELAARGAEARHDIEGALRRARRRARGLAALRAIALLAAGAAVALCAGALVGSFAPALAALAAALILLGIFRLAAPRRLALGLSRLRGGDAAAPPPELSPIVGDLTITYLYPQYTGLPARTEEGTGGDLRAPRGTQVHLTARADRDLYEAVAVVNGKPVKLLAQGPGRRQLSGSLTLTHPGRWSFRFLDAKGRTL